MQCPGLRRLLFNASSGEHAPISSHFLFFRPGIRKGYSCSLDIIYRHQKRPLMSSPLAGLQGVVSYLKNPKNGAEVYLLGTVHLSQASVPEVKCLIKKVKPNIVAIELCENRAKKIGLGEGQTAESNRGVWWKLKEFWNFPGSLVAKMIHVQLVSADMSVRDKGFDPGRDTRVAVEEAKRIKAQIIPIDREWVSTVNRLAQVITLADVINRFKKPSSEFKQQMSAVIQPNLDVNAVIEWLNNDVQGKDALAFLMNLMHDECPYASLLHEPGELRSNLEKEVAATLMRMRMRDDVRSLLKLEEDKFPNLVKVMYHERDEFMAQKLLSCQGKVVAVVGISHMDGIERIWKHACL